MKYKQYSKTFSLSLTQTLYDQISRLAERNESSKGKIIREMIDNYLKGSMNYDDK